MANSDWIAELAKKQRQQYGTTDDSSSSLPKLNYKALSAGTNSAAPERKQTPVGFLVDMLSRPLSGVLHGAEDNFKSEERNVNDIREHGLNIGNAAAAVKDVLAPGLNTGTAKGLFAPGDKNRRTTSQVEQNLADDLNKNYDAGIKLNPVAKGVTGFIGDVAFDPLSYVPGPDLIKGARIIKQGVGIAKAAEEGAKPGVIDALKQGKSAVDAADKVKAAAKAAAEDIKKGVAPAATKAVENVAPTPEVAAELGTPKAVVTEAKQAATKTAQAPLLGQKSADPTKVSDFIKSLAPQAAEDTTKLVKDPSIAAPLDKEAFAKEIGQSGKAPAVFGASHEAAINDATNAMSNSELTKAMKGLSADPVVGPLLKGGSKSGMTLKSAIETMAKQRMADNFDANAFNAAKRVVSGATNYAKKMADNTVNPLDEQYAQYLTKHAAAQAQGKVITADGTELAQATPAAATETMARQIQNFQAAKVAHEASMRGFLGDKTFNALSKITSPDTFDNTVQRMDSIVAGEFDKGALGRSNSAIRAFANERGYLKPQIVDFPEAVRSAEDIPAPVDPAASPKEKVAVQATAAAEHAGLEPNETSDVVKATQNMLEHAGPALAQARKLDQESQYSFVKAMEKIVNKAAPIVRSGQNAGNRALGREAAQARMEKFLQVYTPGRQALERAGLPATMGKGANEINLGYDEMLQSLKDADPLIAELQFNPTGAVAPTNLMDTAAAVVNGETDPNVLVSMLRNDVKDAAGVSKNPINLNPRKFQLGGHVWTRATLLDHYVDTFLQAAPDLQAKAVKNADVLEARASSEGSQLTATTVAQLKDIMDSGTTTDAVKSLLGIKDGIKDEQKAIQALDTSRQLAEAAVDGAVPDVVSEEARQLSNIADATEDVLKRPGITPELVDQTSQATAKAGMKKADAEIAAVEKQLGPPVDLADDFDRKQAVGFLGKVPFLGGFLARTVHDLGFKDLGPIATSAQTGSRFVLQSAASRMNAIGKQFTTEQLSQAAKTINSGIDPATITDETLSKSYQALKPEWDQIYGGEASLLDTPWWRNGTNIQHLNDNLASFHHYNGKNGTIVPKIEIDMNEAAKAAKASGKSIVETSADALKKMAEDDPLNHLMTIHGALAKTNMEHSLAQTFQRWAETAGAFSSTPKPGFVKLVDKSGDSIFKKYLPKKGYYDPYVAEQLHAVDSVMRESTAFGGDFGNFLKNTVDPIMNMWKTGMTILRPGHHIRNNIGDASLTYLALGPISPKHFVNAVKVLAAHNSYDGVDALKSLQAGGFYDIPQTGEHIMSAVLKGGKKVDFTSDGLFHSASNEGLMPNYHASENLDDTSKAGNRIYRGIMENKLTHFAGGVAEYGSHMQNMAHMTGFIEKNSRKFDSQEALLEAAAKDVRKWHLGSVMMTPFEKKYMRRIVPFYSWSRMALPLIGESMLTHPNRVSMFPKAQYNAAVAAGVNPDSMSDPFPTDQMFPSWMTDEGNGPIAKVDGSYFSIAPGIASQDVLSQFVGQSPKSVIGGSLNPLIKDPIELATGTSLQTGAPIKPGEYIDQQIPGVNWISSLAGISPTNSIVNGKITQNASVAAGNKQVGPLSPSTINWLTGIGLTNQSQPNYIKEAQYEQAGKN